MRVRQTIRWAPGPVFVAAASQRAGVLARYARPLRLLAVDVSGDVVMIPGPYVDDTSQRRAVLTTLAYLADIL